MKKVIPLPKQAGSPTRKVSLPRGSRAPEPWKRPPVAGSAQVPKGLAVRVRDPPPGRFLVPRSGIEAARTGLKASGRSLGPGPRGKTALPHLRP